MGIANCLGRVISGKIVDFILAKFGDSYAVYVSFIMMTINGLCMFTLTLYIFILVFVSAIICSEMLPNFYSQLLCSILFGFTDGGFVTIMIVILKKLFEDLDAALGLQLLSCALASIIGPSIVGRKLIKTSSL